jgi:two-component system sensor histidine kinase SenX3
VGSYGAVALTAVLGLVLGAAVALLALRRADERPPGRARDHQGREDGRASVTGELPPGVAEVLAALRHSAAVVDGAGRVVRASPAAYASGVVRGQALGSEALLELVARVRDDGHARDAEVQVPRGALTAQHVQAQVRAAPLARGTLVLVLVDDRTESLRVEAVRRDFVANVSHELKTPVGALRLLAEAVTGASDDPEAVRRFAGRMQHEAERLSVLVQDIIDLSRLQGQDALDAPEVVDLDHVVVDAVDRCRLLAGAKGIRIVHGGDEGVQVLGDEGLLVTALRNLVDNAVSYSPQHTQVSVGVRRTGDVVEVSVADQGIGIPERDLERIFERFYRVDPARSRMTGGTGLGLSIVKHVVANHGGELSVWSVEGAGSTFTLRLPVGAAHALPDPLPDPLPVQEAAP